MSETVSDFLSARYPLESPLVFYRDLFPENELDIRDAKTKGKYCAIAVQVIDRRTVHRHTICDDLYPIQDLIRQDYFTIISPVSYAGKTQGQRFARFLYALTFDLDGLKVSDDGRQIGLEDFIHQASNGIIPMPTYLVSSGNGVHCYYMLENPIPLYSNMMKQLREFRTALTKKIWNEYVTDLWQNPQFESVTQGFRIPGSVCKNGKDRVQAFRTGEKFTIDELNCFVPQASQIRESEYKSIGLETAKKRYPQWYERRIVQGQPKGTWTCKRDLYDWWLRQIESGATVGHRYFCIMALAIYARKSGIEQEELEKDALGLIPYLDAQTVQEDNHFDVEDVMKALEAYQARYITFPRAVIQELTAIDIPPNKRNYRPQKMHLNLMRYTQKLMVEEGMKENYGRPSKRMEVRSFAAAHPDYNISQIASELGVDRKTVRKHLRDDG